MNDIESRLAETMKARARNVEPDDETAALARITSRVDGRRNRALMVLGVAAAIALVIGAVALFRKGEDKQRVGVTATTTTVPVSTTSTTTTPKIVPSLPGPVAIWPFASSDRTFASPEEAAKSFAVEYLGMTNAVVGSSAGHTGEVTGVEIFPNNRGNARTVVRVTQQSSRGWVVVGAEADEIKVSQPAADTALTSPLTIAGQSTAFEATLAVELRPLGSTTPVLKDIAMGGSNGEIGPFTTTITPSSTDQPLVLVLYEGDASGQGAMIKATVISLTAAGASQPTTFVGVTNSGDLVYLDFEGHIQRTLAAEVVDFAFAPTTGTVAYSHTRSCGVDFVRIDGDGGVPLSIDNATAPIFGPNGEQLSYEVCGAGRRVRTMATGVDSDTPADFVVSLPDGVHGELPTLRGRFGTVAFFDGSDISSYDPAAGNVVRLVHPAARVLSLDADESGRFLIWVDSNHDLWTWGGGEPVKVAAGFISAAW